MNIDKIVNFFKVLDFNEEEHVYSVKGKPLKYSVSGLIKNFYREADFDKIALAIDNRDSLSPGTTSILWDLNSKVSLALGTRAHFFGEIYAFNKSVKPLNGYEEAIVKFWKDLPSHIVPVTMELQMYHKDYMFAGTGDILLYNKNTGKYIIGDYKTNKDLFKNHKKQKMVGIFNELLDMPFNHYQLQLSFYQILFEQLGLEVESRKIIWVKPDGNYEMYDTKDYTAELNDYLKHNKVC